MPTRFDFKTLFDASPNPYVLLDTDLLIVGANDKYLQVMEMEREDVVGHHVFDVFPGRPDDSDDPAVKQVQESFERVLLEGTPVTLPLIRYVIPKQTPEGKVYDERFWSATHTPILDDDGEVALILHHTVEVTELQQLKKQVQEEGDAEEGTEAEINNGDSASAIQIEGDIFHRAKAVEETNKSLIGELRLLHQLFEQAPAFISFKRGPDHVFELVNATYKQILGHRDVIGQPAREVLPEVEAQGHIELLDRVYETGEPFVGRELEVGLQRNPGGELEKVYVDLVLQPIIEPDGSVSGIFTLGHDVTEKKRTRDELRRYKEDLEKVVRERTRELEQSQSALQQIQKMEAVGKLTGGVAHDFNNLLQVIGGNLQLLQREMEGDQEAQKRLEIAISAVERGANLSAQLLAFARRQPLEPRVINPGSLVRGMDALLRRALGETVEIETVISGGLWNTMIDPHQLENVILNLALNARDAMDGEGKLTIETGNAMLDDRYARLHSEVTPGQYVLVAITDTGSGMPPEVVERAFEPFFTTKPEEKGTGLGLSMAYGFVKQSGGHIKIYSEVGEGTTVKIYMPRTLREVEDAPEVLTGPVEGGNETILVVEDETDVRNTVVEMLTDLGYRVLRASDGQSALAVIQSGVRVDLLFTDVVMPGPIRSTDLAQQAKALQPNMEVLFTSGYTENAIVHGGRLDPGVSLLSKPYSQEDLARKIRHMLRDRKQRTDAQDSLSNDRPSGTDRQSKVNHEDETLHILLVEDDEPIQLLVTEVVEELGHTVNAVSSAEEALDVFAEEDFNVLFTDFSLPGMSGRTLARTLRKECPDLGVILASGYGEKANAEGDENIEDAFLLPKPYTFSQIEGALKKVLRVP